MIFFFYYLFFFGKKKEEAKWGLFYYLGVRVLGTKIKLNNLTCIIDAANGFSVEYHNWYKIVTNHELNEQYALVCCGQPTTNFTQYHAAVNTPVTNVGVTTIRDLLPYMEVMQNS